MNIAYIFLGIIPAFAWSLTPIIANKIGGDKNKQTFGISLGVLFVGLIFLIIDLLNGWNLNDYKTIITFFMSIVSGIAWYAGIFFQYKVINFAGVAKTIPVCNGGQFVITTLLSGLMFGNWLVSPSTQIPFGIMMILLIPIGLFLLNLHIRTQKNNLENAQTNKKFWIYTTISTLFFVLYFIIPELNSHFILKGEKSNLLDGGTTFPQSLGIIMSCVITGIYKFKKTRENIFIDKRSYLNLFAGLSQGIGNVVFILVALHIGTVIASPLATLSTVIAPLIVIIFFKERKKYPYNLYEYLGFLIITLGILMIAFSNFILSI